MLHFGALSTPPFFYLNVLSAPAFRHFKMMRVVIFFGNKLCSQSIYHRAVFRGIVPSITGEMIIRIGYTQRKTNLARVSHTNRGPVVAYETRIARQYINSIYSDLPLRPELHYSAAP